MNIRVFGFLLLMTLPAMIGFAPFAQATVVDPPQAQSYVLPDWSSPLYLGFNAIDTPDDVHIWAVGSYGLIKYSADGGTTWVTQPAPIVTHLNDVDFVNSTHGWAIGGHGVILHTNDGGDTWRAQTSNVTASLYNVIFVDSQYGWATGGDGTLIRTTNGGDLWQETSSIPEANVNVSKVEFVNRTTGWILSWGDQLWATNDGGSNWSPLTIPVQEGDLIRNVSLLDSQRGWVITSRGDIFATNDGGQMWSILSALPDMSGSFPNIEFTSATEGWIVYRWYSAYGSHHVVYHSSDGGRTWVTTGTSPYSGDGFIVSTTGRLWVAGRKGGGYKGYRPLGPRVYSSVDGGETWDRRFGLHGDIYGARAVELVDENTGFLLTSSHVLITEDGGLTWDARHLFTDSRSDGYDIDSPDGTNIWIVGYQGLILNSADSGVSWHAQTSGAIESLYAINMFNNSLGLAVGTWGRVVRTFDGGNTWTPVSNNTTEHLNDVVWVDATTAIAVGDAGTMLRSIDAGKSWVSVGGITKRNLYSVDFAAGTQSGWAVGQSRTILHTIDGGRSWQAQTPPSIPEWTGIYSVSVVSATEAHAGGRAISMYTYDAGTTWRLDYHNVNTAITDVDFVSSERGLASTSDENKIMRYGQTISSRPHYPTDWVRSYAADQGPTLDGDLSDWPEVEGVLLEQLTANTQKRDLPSRYDLSGTVRSLWTDSTLYFAVSVFDNQIVSDSANVWDDDEVELGIDGLNDSKEGGADDHQYTINADGRKTDQGISTEGFQAAINIRIDGWDAEIAIPAEDLQAGALIAGKVMGFNLGLHDDDTGGPYDTHLIWKGDNTFGVRPGWAGLALLADPASIASPVVIPAPSGDTVTLQDGFLDYAGAKDTYISSWSPDLNYDDSNTLTVRSDGAMAALLGYDISVLPADIAIKQATLSLYPKERSNPQTLDVSIYALLHPWHEGQTTWNEAVTGDSWQVSGADGLLDRESTATDTRAIDWTQRWASFDVTELVQRWSDEALTNNGMVVKYTNGPSVGYDFVSTEVTHWEDTPYRPELIISYWDYEPMPTPTPSVTPTASVTPTSTSTATPTPTLTQTETAVPTETPTKTITPDCADPYEPDNIWQQANLILLNGEIQQHNYHQPGDNDYVKFGAVASDKLTLYTDNLASGVDTTLTLYDSDGITQLAYNDIDPANPPASRITWTAPANGTYFLKAANFNPDTGGCAMTYDLAAERITATSTPTPVPLYLPMIVQ
ncbi:MAG: DNRLRE domain-containing protein [Chloroflexi bacterium]|nr:DNRLRE domain-containing protein [Chloroflexota bacterium]